MDINNLNNETFADLFGPPAKAEGSDIVEKLAPSSFQGTPQTEVDMFSTTPTTTAAPVEAGSPDSSTTTTTTQEVQAAPEADILGQDEKKQAGRKPKYDFSDATGYFEDRIKKGQFVAVEEEDEKGEVRQFVPKTPEDFDEFLELQVNHRLQEKGKGIEQKIYQSKSPAWQAVLKYSELVDDPTEILPFIQGVKTIQSVSDIDETQIEGAEQIIRVRLQQRGEDNSMIEEQIEALKTTDKLISTAAKYKPAILQEEHNRLQQDVQERKKQDLEYQQLVVDIRDKAVKAIEAPIFGKQKLKNEEKMLIYDLIAEPSPETKGYAIYSVIDELFDKRDFETLREVALLLSKKEAYHGYASTYTADNTAASLQRQLRIAGDSRSQSSGNNDEIDDDVPAKPVIQRKAYGPPKFTR